MPEIIVRGKRLGYEARPVDFDPSRLSIVCVHGTGGDRDDWREQLNGLSRRATVIAVELPGHGASEPPPESSVEAYAQWVAEFVAALELQKVMLVGCSLGSAVTQWIALAKKPWLMGIGLVGAGARLRVHPALLDGVLENKERALRLLAGFALSERCTPELKTELSEKFLRCAPELIHADLTACNEFDVMNEVGSVSVPTIIIVGQEDRLTPVKYSEFLHKAIPGSHLEVIADAGHLVMREQPEAFNGVLADFVGKLP